MQGKENEMTRDWFKQVQLNEEEFIIKIGDFGFSKILEKLSDPSYTYCGTPINMAPEMINNKSYNYKSDIWSLGTVLFELLTGYSPFSDAKN